jgi:hypothetical protein
MVRVKEALIGYAWIYITKHSLLYGKYKPRGLNNRGKALLLNSFINNGLDMYTFVNIINVTVICTMLSKGP